MGYLTTTPISNDALGAFKKDPEIIGNIFEKTLDNS
jgi:hypothetical protein